MNIINDLNNLFERWDSEFYNNNRFSEGDLAFLAVTSKFECQFRDIVACFLHSLYKNDYLVAREWGKRIDLALLDKSNPNNPVVLMEFKAVSSAEYIARFKKQIKKDYYKLKRLGDKIDKYLVLCVNLPASKIEHAYKNAVKYFSSVNNYFDTTSSENDKFEELKRKVDNFIPELSLFKFEKPPILNLGNYYTTTIKIAVFVIGPF